MGNFTLLTFEQAYGFDKLDIIKKYGTKAAITDFAILLGGSVSSNYYIVDENTKQKTCWWWTKTEYNDNAACIFNANGNRRYNYDTSRTGGIRPAIPYSDIAESITNKTINECDVLEVEFGEYPQTVVDERFSRELEVVFKRGLKTNGQKFTTDSVASNDMDSEFKAREHFVYEYKGEKYIRFVANKNSQDKYLSDGRIINSGDIYWVKVEPIKWLVDTKTNIAISKKLIVSGIQFKNKKDRDIDFSGYNIKWFLDRCFAKDMSRYKTHTQYSEKYNTNEPKENNDYSDHNNNPKWDKEFEAKHKESQSDVSELEELKQSLLDEINNALNESEVKRARR